LGHINVGDELFLRYSLLHRKEGPEDECDDEHVHGSRDDRRSLAPILLHRVLDRDWLRREDERGQLLRGIEEIVDVVGNRLPRRFINDLSKQPWFFWLLLALQLRR